jgi:probable HAF family extracellular repeat protein
MTGRAGVLAAAALAAAVVVALSTDETPAGTAGCSPRMEILTSPRAGSHEVQAKALNDLGDVVGFADGADGTFRAILWKRGGAAGALDLGVLPGYVSSEAYGINDHRVVYGVLYDSRDRTYPFRWRDGRMVVLRDPHGRLRQVALPDPSRNPLNQRGELVATLLVDGARRAVRWAPDGTARYLPALPGHAWTWANSVDDRGVVSGWSREMPAEHAVERPAVWTRQGKALPLTYPRGRGDGVANASNGTGLVVGLLGNAGTAGSPESDQAAVWPTADAAPRLLGPSTPYAYAELLDVNEEGQAIGALGTFTKQGFPLTRGALWQPGWTGLHPLPVPTASRRSRVVVTALDDVNDHGAVVGNVYGLSGPSYDELRRIDPVLWTCPFG